MADISMDSLVEALRAQLSASATDYLCVAPLDGTRARLRFIGRFEQQDVVWDAELVALGTAAAVQFIEVGAPGPQGLRISVGVGVDRIDLPTVLKTIIMVRNYKRLRRGRHEYGGTSPA